MTKKQWQLLSECLFLIAAGIVMFIWQWSDQKQYDELYNTGAHFQAKIVDNYTTYYFRSVPIAEFTIQDQQKRVELGYASGLKVGDNVEIVFNPTSNIKAMPANAERTWQLYVVGGILLIVGLLGLYYWILDLSKKDKSAKPYGLPGAR